MLSHVQVVATRNRKGRRRARILVPTAVRVEAGWDRSDPRAAFVNLLGIADAALDGVAANGATAIRAECQVSLADAHLGATVRSVARAAPLIVVITSDPRDVARVAGVHKVTVVAI